jgi:flagellar biosynthesis protein FlhG
MTKSIMFVSGKGGVGKSMCSTNIATALSLSGSRVLLLDADFGLANANIMLGIKSEYSLGDVLDEKVTIEQAVSVTDEGLKVLSGGSGLPALIGIDQEKRLRIVRLIEPLESQLDYLIIDAPAGIEENALCFAAASDEICLVLTGDPTSFMDAYATVKVLSLEKKIDRITVIVNMVDTIQAGNSIFNRFEQIVCKFLPATLTLAGIIPTKKKIKNSVQNRQPIMRASNVDEETKLILDICDSVVTNVRSRNPGEFSFFQGLLAGNEIGE